MDTTSAFKYLHSHEAFFAHHGRKVTFVKNQYFVRPDDPQPWVFFLKEGLVKVSFTLKDGSERIIGYFIPGMTFAQNRTFYEDDGGGLEYCTLTPTVAYRIDRADFLRQVQSDPDFNNDYIQSLLRNQVFLIDRITYQGESTIYEKCLRWLLFMAKYYCEPGSDGCKIVVPITQDTIANFLHASRESVSKCLKKLAREGLISVDHKYITLKSTEAIKLRLEKE